VQTDLGGDWGEWGAEGCPAELQHWHLTWTSPHQPCLSCLQASALIIIILILMLIIITITTLSSS